jgi:general secretion pathway protein H
MMPTLVAGVCKAPARWRAQGFTLIELLVVLVILGVVLALARVNLMPDARQELQREAAQLALLLELAGDTAATRGGVIGCVLSPRGYRFEQQNAQGDWVALTAELRPRSLPEAMALSGLQVRQQVVPLGERLLLTASGPAASFEVMLLSGPYRLRLVADVLGHVRVVDEHVAG